MRRYVATISVYVYVDEDGSLENCDQLAIKKAKNICKKLDKKYDCNAAVVEIGEQPYASTSYREI